MPINPTTYDMPQAFSGGIDFSPLAKLGDIYRATQDRTATQNTLGQLGSDPNANARLLIGSGQMPLVQLGLAQQNRLTDQQREDARYKVTDPREDERLRIARETADRANMTDEERLTEKKNALTKMGIPLDSPYGQQLLFGVDPGAAQRSERSIRVQENQDARAAATAAEEGSPSARAKTAIDRGLKPGSPEYNEYVFNKSITPDASATFGTTMANRKAAALAVGLNEGSPGYQSYMLTGKMPREDAQPLTATDKKAILEADQAVMSGQNVIASLNRAKELSPKAFQGPGAGPLGYGASFLGEGSEFGKRGIATTDLTNEVTTNALSQLKAIFGAAPTEGERKILLDIQGSVSQPDVVRQKIFNRAIGLAQARLNMEMQRANELRGHTFYQQGGGMTTPPPTAAVPAPAAGAASAGGPRIEERKKIGDRSFYRIGPNWYPE